MAWIKVKFRKKDTVWAEVNDEGEFITDADGRVGMKYNEHSEKVYRAAARNLGPVVGGSAAKSPSAANASPAAKAPSKQRRKNTPDPNEPPPYKRKLSNTMVVERGPIPKTGSPDRVVAFTDGACTGNPGPCGAGAVVLIPDQEPIYRSAYLGTGTNNIGELVGVLHALEIARAEAPGQPITVYTDSRYAIGVLGKGFNARKNQELIAYIHDEMERHTSIVLHKVKGHAGHPLNEKADELAVRAVSTRSPEEPVPSRSVGGSSGPRPSETPSVAPAPSDDPKSTASDKNTASDSATTSDRGRAKVATGPKKRVHIVEKPSSIPLSPEGEEVLAFTDGACSGNPGPAGLGAVILKNGEEPVEISESLGRATNNIAELTAILRVLEHVASTDEVRIFTDSSYAMGVLGKGWKAKANQDLIEEIRAACQRPARLCLVKVKGHAGHEHNERADELARMGIR